MARRKTRRRGGRWVCPYPPAVACGNSEGHYTRRFAMANEPQKSEVHEATADAGTNPTAGRDPDATRRTQATEHEERAWRDGPGPVDPVPPTDARIVDDQTDDGGPLV